MSDPYFDFSQGRKAQVFDIRTTLPPFFPGLPAWAKKRRGRTAKAEFL
jgi:hypothetical protein